MTHSRTFTAVFLALSITGYSGAQTVRCTTWNLEWFPNGSAHEASAVIRGYDEAGNVIEKHGHKGDFKKW